MIHLQRYQCQWKENGIIFRKNFVTFRNMKRFVRKRRITLTKFFFFKDNSWQRFVRVGRVNLTKQLWLNIGSFLITKEYDVNLF